MDRFYRISRRKFLASAAALTVSGAVDPASAGAFLAKPPQLTREGRRPLAVIATVYRPLSDAYHLVGRFLHGYPHEGQLHVPDFYVHSLHVDQRPGNDLSKEVGREHKVRLCRTIEDALTGEGDQLCVDGVLLIAEHGNYPRNEKGQVLYPRHEMLKTITDVFRKTGQSVPVFNDRHLCHDWSKAKEMVGWSQELSFPLMSGSFMPMTWRRPELEIPSGSVIEDALVACFGPTEIYGFQALEALQVMLEKRKGGETGIASVRCLQGKQVWKAGDDGEWSWDLLQSALSRSETVNLGDVRYNVGRTPVQKMPKTPAVAFLIEYRDGTRGTVLLLNGHVQDFTFAAKLKDEEKPVSCMFHVPPPPGAKSFDLLAHQIEQMLQTNRSPVPTERSLLLTGALARAMESHHFHGSRLEAPELSMTYSNPDDGFARGGVAAQ